MTIRPVVLAVLATVAMPALAADPPPYEAEFVTENHGSVTHLHVLSDGVHMRRMTTVADGTVRGVYSDKSRSLAWGWTEGPNPACLQLTTNGGAPRPDVTRTDIGRDTIEGHAVTRMRVHTQGSFAGKPYADDSVQWVATDLGDLVLRSESEKYGAMHVESLKLGAPPAAMLTLEATPCHYDRAKDDSAYAAQAPGTLRTLEFFDFACKKIVPLAIGVSLPSDFEIRLSPPHDCFAGRHDDLDRLLAKPGDVDLKALTHGVYWTRVSASAEYTGAPPHFVSEYGPDDGWETAMAADHVTDLHLDRSAIAGMPSVRISGTRDGRPLRMCYLGVAGSPAILVSYQAPPTVTAADDVEWKRFLAALSKTPAAAR